MDTRTGHLMSGEAMERLRTLDKELAAGYTEVPKRLSRAARRKLAGRDEATVSLTSGGKLSRWAAHERAKAAKAKRRAAAKRKTRRKMAKATRRAQRSR
jgi:hypothetical protein